MIAIPKLKLLREEGRLGAYYCRLFLFFCCYLELRFFTRLQHRGSEISLPFGQIHPSQSAVILYVSRTHINHLSFENDTSRVPRYYRAIRLLHF